MIIAIVVTFNPDDGFRQRLASYAGQVGRVYIVDNSTEAERTAFVQSLAGDTIEIIPNRNRGGLAGAQNIGIAKALIGGAEWVALFDDDSTASPGMLDRMLQAPRGRRTGILVPEVVDASTGHAHRFLVWKGPFIWRRASPGEGVATAIASGMLLSTELLKDCGYLREEYHIDWVDIEYCLRAQVRGWKIMAVENAKLEHALGAKQRHGAFIASHHATHRRYTMSRNRMDVWKRYAARFPGYVLYDMLVANYEALKIICFEQEKGAKLAAMLRGYKDGLLGRFLDEESMQAG